MNLTLLAKHYPVLDRNGLGITRGTPDVYRCVFGEAYSEFQEESFRSDISSIIWFTYRFGFQSLHPYALDSDVGWGCMLRCAQMLMAQGLQRHFFGRKWRWPPRADDRASNKKYCTFMRWFADRPGPESPYSIHNICQMGFRHDKLPGEWYGPGAASCVLRDLFIAHSLSETDPPSSLNLHVNALKLHVALGGAVYESELDSIAAAETMQEAFVSSDDEMDPLQRPPPPPATWESSVLLIVTLRLGLDCFNRDYIPSLKHMLRLPITLGFLGGKPNLAMYFFGTEEGNLISFDPHKNQAALTGNSEVTASYCETTMCKNPSTVDFSRLDPSLAMAFYLKSRDDLQLIKSALDVLQVNGNLAPFSIEMAPPNYEANIAFGNDDDVHSEGQIEDSYVII